MASFKRLVRRLVREESAQGITEYGLILGLVVLGMWAAISVSGLGAEWGAEITALFNRIKAEVNSCGGGGGGVGGGGGGGCGSGGGGGVGGGSGT